MQTRIRLGGGIGGEHSLGGFGYADPLTATPRDQYLPPNFPGFKDVEIYPLSGDLQKAKQLAGMRSARP